MVHLIAAFAAAATLATGVSAWGASGHQAVGYVAQAFLAPKALSFVQTSLGSTYSQSLGPAATWADDIKSQASYKWASELHYVDAEDSPLSGSCSVSQTRDCPTGRCILTAIANYTTRVGTTSLSAAQRGEALKFLDHFLGDIGQPLHVEAYEVGGNDIDVTCGGQSTNLHATWDTGILETSLAASYSKSVTTYASALVARIKTGTYSPSKASWISCSSTTATASGAGSGRLPTTREEIAAAIATRSDVAKAAITPLKCPLVWAAEANAYDCTNVFNYSAGTDLCKGTYYTKAVTIIDLQIAKQGYRLAAWLNMIFDGKTM